MKKITLMLLSCLLVSLSVCAKNKQYEPLPSYGLLWKITGNGLQTPSYLLGTYHARGGMQILDSIKGFDSIFNSTNQLLCESIVDFRSISKQDGNSDSNKLMNLIKPWPVPDSTYENLLTKSQKHLLDSVINADKFLTHRKQFNLRPLRLLSSIKFSYSDIIKNAIRLPKGYVPPTDSVSTPFLDLHLQIQAKMRKIPVIALDKVEERNIIHDSLYSNVPQLSYKSEIGILMDYVEHHATIDSLKKEEVNKYLSLYLKQEIGLILNLDKFINSYKMDDPLLPFFEGKKFIEKRNRLIVDERNKNWLKQIPGLIEKKSSLIAVGAAHLPGEKGIINQLRELGYTVTLVQRK